MSVQQAPSAMRRPSHARLAWAKKPSGVMVRSSDLSSLEYWYQDIVVSLQHRGGHVVLNPIVAKVDGHLLVKLAPVVFCD